MIPASILGKIKYPGALIPMISKASICSVTRIEPICEEIDEPTLPIRTKAEIVGPNSKILESRLIEPIIEFGIRSETNWKAICIVITAPIKVEIITISPRDPRPISFIACIVSFQ
ncbi:hypothetical protein D9M71_696140 [compost metagenome]